MKAASAAPIETALSAVIHPRASASCVTGEGGESRSRQAKSIIFHDLPPAEIPVISTKIEHLLRPPGVGSWHVCMDTPNVRATIEASSSAEAPAERGASKSGAPRLHLGRRFSHVAAGILSWPDDQLVRVDA